MQCKVTKLHDNARLPVRASRNAAGYDVYSSEDVVIPPRSRAAVPLGIALEITDPEHYVRIAPRSGLALNKVDVAAGVVDADFRGMLKVILVNHDDVPKVFSAGSKIAQLIFEKVSFPTMTWANELSTTERGDGGFGSTGLY